jgi:hypothetical protein
MQVEHVQKFYWTKEYEGIYAPIPEIRIPVPSPIYGHITNLKQ